MATRKNIRWAVVNMLTGATSVGTNVYASRETPLWELELPAIIVHSRQETSEPQTLNGNKYVRTLELEVNVKAQATIHLDDVLDDLASEIEAILGADRTLLGTTFSCVLTGTTITLDVDGDIPTGTLTLTYTVKYIN